MNLDKPFEYFSRMPRFAPVFSACFIFSVLLLFHRELGWPFLFPAIIVYIQGATIIGTMHRMIAIRFEDPEISSENESTIPYFYRWILFIAHILWFFLLVTYLFSKNIL